MAISEELAMNEFIQPLKSKPRLGKRGCYRGRLVS